MTTMPRPRPPHLLREVSRYGTVSWVVRFGHGAHVHLRAVYGTPAFEAEYDAAIRGEPVSGPQRPLAAPTAWLPPPAKRKRRPLGPPSEEMVRSRVMEVSRISGGNRQGGGFEGPLKSMEIF